MPHSLAGISINAGCRWTDEFSWSPVKSSAEHSITGALIVDQGVRLAGRPITLEASDEGGWKDMTRDRVIQLRALTAQAGLTFPLTLADGRSFTVIFRPGEEPFDARPLADRENPPTDWPYIITLRLTEV
jgi:hypothetical protein